MSAEEKVIEQQRKFEAELPELMRKHAGKWAVYFDGLKGILDTENDAIDWAFANLEAKDSWIVVRVKKLEPLHIRW